MNEWRWELFLPTVMIIESAMASAVYTFHGEPRKAIYWLCAAIITLVVTY